MIPSYEIYRIYILDSKDRIQSDDIHCETVFCKIKALTVKVL